MNAINPPFSEGARHRAVLHAGLQFGVSNCNVLIFEGAFKVGDLAIDFFADFAKKYLSSHTASLAGRICLGVLEVGGYVSIFLGTIAFCVIGALLVRRIFAQIGRQYSQFDQQEFYLTARYMVFCWLVFDVITESNLASNILYIVTSTAIAGYTAYNRRPPLNPGN